MTAVEVHGTLNSCYKVDLFYYTKLTFEEKIEQMKQILH